MFKKMSYFAGKLCIEVAPADKIAFISEELCIGCGICAKASREHFILCFFINFVMHGSCWVPLQSMLDASCGPSAKTLCDNLATFQILPRLLKTGCA